MTGDASTDTARRRRRSKEHIYGLRGRPPVACDEAVYLTSRMPRTQACSCTSFATLLWVYCFASGVVPSVRSVPPHQRACPGPLDKSVGIGACRTQGTATLSDKVFRTEGGERSSDCHLHFEILKCLVRLSAGMVIIPVYRDGGFSGTGSVRFSTIAGTAQSDVLFRPNSGSISWESFRVRLHPSPMCF